MERLAGADIEKFLRPGRIGPVIEPCQDIETRLPVAEENQIDPGAADQRVALFEPLVRKAGEGDAEARHFENHAVVVAAATHRYQAALHLADRLAGFGGFGGFGGWRRRRREMTQGITRLRRGGEQGKEQKKTGYGKSFIHIL